MGFMKRVALKNLIDLQPKKQLSGNISGNFGGNLVQRYKIWNKKAPKPQYIVV